MKINSFWKNVLTFGMYALWAGFKKKNKDSEWTLVVETLLASRAGTPMTREQLNSILLAEMERKNLTQIERELAISMLNNKLDKMGL